MGDELVTIRHLQTKETRQVAGTALPFFVGDGKQFELAEEVAAAMPAAGAHRADWVAYATGPGGLSQEVVDDMTIPQLVKHFSPTAGGDSTTDTSQED